MRGVRTQTDQLSQYRHVCQLYHATLSIGGFFLSRDEALAELINILLAANGFGFSFCDTKTSIQKI